MHFICFDVILMNFRIFSENNEKLKNPADLQVEAMMRALALKIVKHLIYSLTIQQQRYKPCRKINEVLEF